MTAFTDLIAAFSSDKRFICHLQPYDPDTAAVVDLYYSTHGFTSEPSDTPANQHYAERLSSGYRFTRSLFQSGKLSGRTIPGAGEIRLINQDGGLDALQDYAWGGRRMRVWMGGVDFDLADYGLVVDATAQGISFANDEVVIELRDLQHILDREIQSSVFAGSGGAEGGADVKDKRKPQPWGITRNARLIYLGKDTGKHMFAAADDDIIGVIRVRDLGLELTFNSGTPGASEWTCDLAAGTITLGGAYNGPITADIIGRRYLSTTSTTSWAMATGSKAFTVASVSGLAVGMQMRVARTAALSSKWGDGKITAIAGSDVTINITSLSSATGTHTDWTLSPWGTAAGIIKAIGTALGVTSFDTASFTALDAAQPATVGYWIPEGGNGLQQLDAIANGIAGYYGFNRAGQFNVGRLTAPSSPAADYAPLSLVPDADAVPIEDTLRRLPTEDPNWQVVVRGYHNWAGDMSSNELAGAVSDADRAFLSNEWRQETDDDVSVQTLYPYSTPLIIDSIFDETADMAAEATRLLALFGVKRDFFEQRYKLQPLLRNLPETITLTDARYGLSGGKDLRITEFDEDTTPTVCEVGLQLWG